MYSWKCQYGEVIFPRSGGGVVGIGAPLDNLPVIISLNSTPCPCHTPYVFPPKSPFLQPLVPNPLSQLYAPPPAPPKCSPPQMYITGAVLSAFSNSPGVCPRPTTPGTPGTPGGSPSCPTTPGVSPSCPLPCDHVTGANCYNRCIPSHSVQYKQYLL